MDTVPERSDDLYLGSSALVMKVISSSVSPSFPAKEIMEETPESPVVAKHPECRSDNTTTTKNVFKEVIVPGLNYEIEIKQQYAETKSEFQDIQVVETCFGKTLLLDGLTQSTQMDEFIYHESLVHPAILQCVSLRRHEQSATTKPPELTVMIGGGGELATARELLRYPADIVKRVIMVELDAAVVQVSQQYLPEWGGAEVMRDPRFELVIGDAFAYIQNYPQHEPKSLLDVIIMDISDPVEAGPGIALYTQEFYELAAQLLRRPGGVFVTQAGMAEAAPSFSSPNNNTTIADSDDEEDEEPMVLGPILNALHSAFDVAQAYTINIPSFGSDWAFVMASHGSNSSDSNPTIMPPDTVDDLLREMQLVRDDDDDEEKESNKTLRHYDGLTHCRMFALPKPLRRYLKAEKRIMNKDNPLFLYNG